VKVAYNATFARVGGGLSYVTDQIRALTAVAGIDLTVFAGPAGHEQLRTVCSEVGARFEPVRVPSTGLRFAWEQIVLPWRVRGHEVLVCPGNFCPLFIRTPTLLILQTSALVGAGRAHGAGAGKRLRVFLSHRSMISADRLVVISEPLATEVLSEPGLAHLTPVVVRSGVPAVATPSAGSRAADRATATAVVGPHPYVLSVAHDYEHKRLGDLGRLAARMGAPSPERDGDVSSELRIALVGDISERRQAEIRSTAGPGADRLVFVGVVTDADVVRALYASAAVAVTTSALEAWNFTIHEASSQGTPLVATDLPIHQELGGDHVHYYPVGDVDALAAATNAAAIAPRPDPWVPDWTWQRHGTELAALIRDLAGTGGER